MKASIRTLVAMLSVITAVALVMPFSALDACAQQKAAKKGDPLIGTWTLVSLTNEQDGKTTEPLGPNPKGLFFFDRSGHYAFLLFVSDLPKFASNSRDKGTPEENRAIVVGSLAHFGTYSVNEKEGSFTVHPEASTFPNWVGIDQKRLFSISKDEFKMTNPSSSRGSGVNTLILKRAK
jgi:hypothetical protein